MCLAALKESSELTIQVCCQPLTSEVTTKNMHSHRVPVIPSKFDNQVQTRFFTIRDIDCPTIAQLYHGFFENYFYNITVVLDFSGLTWLDNEVETLMHDVVRQGYARWVTELHLVSKNHITATATALLLRHGKLYSFSNLQQITP
jgi:hypothetical protein